MKVIGIIPARYASTRFPGKPLAMINGKSMIQRVYEQASKSNADDIFVATDDARIYDHVESFYGKAIMTSPHHVSGTDRCLEATEKSELYPDAVINIQGDEPMIDPSQINDVISLIKKPGVDIATLAVPIADLSWLNDPNKVKVIRDINNKAIYFSRASIPYVKNKSITHPFPHLKHLGIYGYRTQVLKSICALSPSSLEIAESLEQLRWLENGFSIHVGLTQRETPAIDTPEDLDKLLENFPD